MNRNVIIIDSDSTSAFILQRSLELLAPDQRFNTKTIGSLNDFNNDLRSPAGLRELENLSWVIIDTKYIWQEKLVLIDVLQFIRAYAPQLKLVITTEYFSENLFRSIVDQKLVDEFVVKPFGKQSLQSLVSSCY